MNAFIRNTFNSQNMRQSSKSPYHLTRAKIQEVLIDFVHPHLVRATRCHFALTPTVPLVAALRLHASGSLYKSVSGAGLALSKATISRAVMVVIQVPLQLPKRGGLFHPHQRRWPESTKASMPSAVFPRVTGVIDGTPIQIAEDVHLVPEGMHPVGLQVGQQAP